MQRSLADDVETFLAVTGRSATRFGWDAMGDPRFVHELRNGRVPGHDTEVKVREFISANAPENGLMEIF
jgi:hypothetical protein